jgi:general secretion pathway protein A
MYEQFFGLRERPFDLTPNPRFLVLTESHREVLSNLEYGIASRKGITLVVGEAGSGKTTLIRKVLEKQGHRVHSVAITNPTLTRDEFVETMANRFGLSAAAASSKSVFLRELEALLRERYTRNETTVLVVDEAQSLPIELLEEIRLLANTETNEEKLLPVILAGQPELADRLNEPELRQLKQRVALRCELHPLTERETASYVAGRISVAGGLAPQVFTREAVSLIHAAAGGVPRLVSVIADNALLGGFARGEKPVGSHIVAEVCRDFSLDVGARRPATRSASTPVFAEPELPAVVEEVTPTRGAGFTTQGGLVTVPQPPGPGLFSMFLGKRKRFFLG